MMHKTTQHNPAKVILAAALTFVMTLAVIFTILPATTLTAHAAVVSDSFDTSTGGDYYDAVTWTGNHFKVSINRFGGEGEGFLLNDGGYVTIESLNGEDIGKVVLTANWSDMWYPVEELYASPAVGTFSLGGTNGSVVTLVNPNTNRVEIHFTETHKGRELKVIRVEVWAASHTPVTLNVDGGTINSGNITEYNEKVGAALPSDVTKEGYVFKGWYNNEAFTGKAITSISANDTGEKTFWAKWAHISDIVYNLNGGTINGAYPEIYLEGDGAALPSNVTKDGKVFAGWYDNEALTGDAVTAISAGETGDKSYWAKWNLPIAYNVNGGTINGSRADSYYEGDGATLPADVTKNGYTFAGWYVDEAFDGDIVTAIGTEETGAKEYWAKWNPIIIYENLNGGTINGDHAEFYVEGVGATLPADVTRADGTFLGWYDNADFQGDPLTAIGPEETGTKTVWSKWISNIVYHPEGGTILGGYAESYEEGVGGTTLPVSVVDDSRRFIGWCDNSALLGEVVTVIGADARGAQEYWAKWTVPYMAWNKDSQTVAAVAEDCAEFTPVGSGIASWTDGWYVVSANVTVASRVNVSGTVHLILCDGATLTVNGGINVTPGNALHVYGQTAGTGTLTITGVASYNAGIGGGDEQSGGAVTIHGGTVISNAGSSGAAGIGGGYGGHGGAVTIYGGTVVAIGARAGIGGGDDGNGGTVTIYGGTVIATGGFYGAGIGGSGYSGGAGGVVTIYGGYVRATGGNSSAGIGSSSRGSGGTVAIYGGYVTATGAGNSAGIGGGNGSSDNGTLTIGGDVVVWTNGNDTTSDPSIRTQNMVVMAPVAYMARNGSAFEETNCSNYKVVESNTTSWEEGWYVVFGSLTISERITASGTVNLILADGATLTASKGITATGATLNIYTQHGGTGAILIDSVDDDLAGIGGGSVNVYGGTVTATGGANGAGISNLTVYDGNIIANGGENAVAIDGTLTVENGLSVVSGSTVIGQVDGDYARSASMRVCRLSSVTLNTNGGVINSGSVGFYIKGAGAVLPADVTREGYLFLGWYADADFTGNVVRAIDTEADGDKTFYAKWKFDLVGAYDACEEGGTIVLPEDLDLSDEADGFLVVTKNITIDLNGHILNMTAAAPGAYVIKLQGGAVITLDDSSENVGGVKGIVGVDNAAGSYLVLKNCRLTFTAAQTLSDAEINRIAEAFIVKDIENAPDADGFACLVRPMVDQDYADIVAALIAAIGEVEYTEASKEKIDAAQAAYDALTDAQKALVGTSSALTAAEDTYEIKEVIAFINVIGEVEYTEVSKEKIDAAKAKYDLLSDEQKAQVTNAATLTTASDTYEVKEVIALIGGIGEVEYTDEVRARIAAAREAYNNLTDEQKAQVGVANTLTDAEDAYTDLAVEAINELIDIDEVGPDDKEDVLAAKAAYDAMTPEEQASVPSETLAKLNAAVKEITDIEAAGEAAEGIADLPVVGELSLEDKDDVAAARAAYEALTDDQKAKVSQETLAALEAAEKEIVDIETAGEATANIAELPVTDDLTIESKDAVEAARAAYDALSDEGKAKVSDETVAKLAEAESVIADIESIVVTEGESTTYSKEIDKEAAETGVNVKQLFKKASGDDDETKEVAIKTGDSTVVFDSAAVDAIGDANATFSLKVSEEAPAGAELMIDIKLSGATFADGKAKVSTKFDKVVPAGKKLTVYYCEENGNKTAMKTWFSDGVVTFETNHFSTYLVVMEEEEAGNAGRLSGGAIAGIVIGSVVLLLIIACAVLFVLNKKGVIHLAFLDKKAKE